MDVFSNYARYYNLFYQDKNYQNEVDYVDLLLQKHASFSIKNILDLGCGTGKHDFLFSKKGYQVTGIDFAQEMIEIANQTKKNLPNFNAEFQLGDIRNIRLNRLFDGVVSLFHVASYQSSNTDINEFFQTAKTHLKKNGCRDPTSSQFSLNNYLLGHELGRNIRFNAFQMTISDSL